MNKILEEQYQRKIDSIFETEDRIISTLNGTNYQVIQMDEGKILTDNDIYTSTIISLRELIHIYDNQICQFNKTTDPYYAKIYDIFGLHMINQCKEFIEPLNSMIPNIYGRDYKMVRQIILDLQRLIERLYQKFGLCQYELYQSNEIKIEITRRNYGDYISMYNDCVGDLYLYDIVDNKVLLKENCYKVLKFIQKSVNLYNGKKINIYIDYSERKENENDILDKLNNMCRHMYSETKDEVFLLHENRKFTFDEFMEIIDKIYEHKDK